MSKTIKKKLWRVTVEYELFVVADNEQQAEEEVEYYAGEDGTKPAMVVATSPVSRS